MGGVVVSSWISRSTRELACCCCAAGGLAAPGPTSRWTVDVEPAPPACASSSASADRPATTARDRVGVLLVRIARVAHAVLQLHAAALLHDVRGLVRRGVEAWRAGESDVIADRVGLGADCRARLARGRAGVRADARHVVAAERALDDVQVGQRRGGASDPVHGCSMDIARLSSALGGLALDRDGGGDGQELGQRALAGDEMVALDRWCVRGIPPYRVSVPSTLVPHGEVVSRPADSAQGGVFFFWGGGAPEGCLDDLRLARESRRPPPRVARRPVMHARATRQAAQGANGATFDSRRLHDPFSSFRVGERGRAQHPRGSSRPRPVTRRVTGRSGRRQRGGAPRGGSRTRLVRRLERLLVRLFVREPGAAMSGRNSDR